VQELPLRYAPGTQYAYNQTGYALMGKIIEKLSGKPFVDFVREGQFNAAGMEQARFGHTADTVPELASLYTYLTLKMEGMRAVGVERSEIELTPKTVRSGGFSRRRPSEPLVRRAQNPGPRQRQADCSRNFVQHFLAIQSFGVSAC